MHRTGFFSESVGNSKQEWHIKKDINISQNNVNRLQLIFPYIYVILDRIKYSIHFKIK